jgi:DnaJ-class molecular chaperone
MTVDFTKYEGTHHCYEVPECPDCEGTGEINVDAPRYHDLTETCWRCGGTGIEYEEADDDDAH